MSPVETLDGDAVIEAEYPILPPATEEELAEADTGDLPDPDTEPELYWYRTIYQGDNQPQLTFRAVLMGSALGALMCLSNLYVGLKTGWGLGVAITACIMSFAIYKTLRTIAPRWFGSDMSLLENNCMQSTATSAGSSVCSVLVSAIPAYLMLTHHQMDWHVLGWWTFFLAVLGVFLAIPMKRQMINVEQLKFPSGTAAAETLRSLHSEGAEAMDKARSLGWAGLFGAALTWFRDSGCPARLPWLRIPSSLPFPGRILGIPLAKFTIQFDMSAIMVAAGAIMGWKIAWSLLLGATINYAVLAPWMLSLKAIDPHLGYRAIVSWSTWTGASMMVASGLLVFFMQWRTILKALSGLVELFGKKVQGGVIDPLARIEVPFSWTATGVGVSGLGLMYMLHHFFGTSIWMGFVAVAMTFFLALVACRATGESDITPIGAMGKITQLLFGTLAPTNIITNLMTASVTAGAAGASADLLTDLKSGYLLGANPRKQFLAQFYGIFVGTVVVVPAFYVLVPTYQVLGGDKWPAPAAQVWAKVAELLANGFHSLHYTEFWGMGIGAAIGVALPLLEMALPRYKRFIPSATGVGLAFVIPWFNSLSMFLGAVIAALWERFSPKSAEKYVVPVSSGVIAGESLMGIVVALLVAAGIIAGT